MSDFDRNIATARTGYRTDQVAIDAFGATLLGYKPQEIGYVVEGHARRLGTIDFESLKPRRIEVG